MSFEQFASGERKIHESEELAFEFKSLPNTPKEPAGFEHLKTYLEEGGFELVVNTDYDPEYRELFHNGALICRSESFTKVLNLIVEDTPITISNTDGKPNMCTMSSGKGYRVAMHEGFSGKEVSGVVTVVITFYGEHLHSQTNLSRNDELWTTKPDTAEVSFVGTGDINKEDIEMVSFRFPVHLFPDNLLFDEEAEHLESRDIRFITRHYRPKKEKTAH